MVSHTCLNVAKYPTGIESRVKDINVLLSTRMNDIRMIGIFGVGGIGKTTIAKAIYNLIACQFEDSCFLANVRENSKRECGLVQLQETLLSEILGDSSLKVHNVDRGINVIKQRFRSKKVLLVLDDVDQSIQLETLSGERDWFGLGSRIIITTRDEHLLTKHKVDSTYKMNELDHNEALQLFRRHAFESDKPNDDFVKLTKHALRYAGGLPLALMVLGSNLYGRDINFWKSTLDKYKRIPEKNIYERLKISYDGLEKNEKKIFLDIACFFIGQNVNYVTKILDSCGFFPDSGIKELIEKSLITIESNGLVMHDLLQDMGREIVKQESPEEPGKRSRLWDHEDVRYVLEENMGTKKIEGILVELPEPASISLSSKTFKKMKRLRLFINRNACFFGKPNSLPNELRVLDWANCPLQSWPSNFHGKKLRFLRMHNGFFKEGFKNFTNLRIMEFVKCKFLKEIPDISGIPNLEDLRVEDCQNLANVHDSVGFLDKLIYLSFLGCFNLTSLPRSFNLRSLEFLALADCSRLQNFPEIQCEIKGIMALNLNNTGIKELPSSIINFTRLFILSLEGCENLVHLPSNIFQLQHLQLLYLRKCSKLVKLPTKEYEIPSSTELFSALPLANSDIFDDVCSPIGFPALTFSNLEECTCLVPKVSKETSKFQPLRWIDLSECYKMLNTQNLVANLFLGKVHFKEEFGDYFGGGIIFPGNTIPDWFSHRKGGTSYGTSCEIDINGLPRLDEINGIVFCAVIGHIPGISPSLSYDGGEFRIINKGELIDDRGRTFELFGSDHVWLEFSLFKESPKLKGDSLQLEFSMRKNSLFIKSCGVHVIYKHEGNANDHPGGIHVNFNYDSYEFRRKRRRESAGAGHGGDGDGDGDGNGNDDDCNLESSFQPQQKKRRGVLDQPLVNHN